MKISWIRAVLRWALGAGLMLGMPSCGWLPPKAPPRARMVWFDWADDGGPGELAVRMNLASQIATFERGGRPIGWSYVCSGKPGHVTPPGNFTILEKQEVQFSDRYGWLADVTGKVTLGDATPATPVPPGEYYSPAPMYHWMRLTTYGIGMHAGEIRVPGVAASHGCVRLPGDLATKLYAAAVVGTPVTIIAPEGGQRQEKRGVKRHHPKSVRTAGRPRRSRSQRRDHPRDGPCLTGTM